MNIKPIGEPVDYTTNPNKSQIFNYFFDDGEYVAGGLDEYLASIHTEQGTFSSEQLLLMTYKIKSNELPDSIIPFSYILGTNYTTLLNKEVEYRINTNYPYNNNAHKEYLEEVFFKEHISEMVLYKFEMEEIGSYYFDPNITLIEYPFTIDDNSDDIIFKTKDINSSYALCWKEKPWIDSINFYIQDGVQTNSINIIDKGKKNNINSEGAIYKNNILYLTYLETEIDYQQSTNDTGWTVRDINIEISDLLQGTISHNNIKLDILIKDKNGLLTQLLISDNTQIEMETCPDFGEKGKLIISGQMYIQSYQRNVNVNLEIIFYRQR